MELELWKLCRKIMSTVDMNTPFNMMNNKISPMRLQGFLDHSYGEYKSTDRSKFEKMLKKIFLKSSKFMELMVQMLHRIHFQMINTLIKDLDQKLKIFTNKNEFKKKFIRIIPRLDIKNNFLIKGINLEGLRVLGEPYQFAKFYSETGADEIHYFDSVASLYGTII